MAMISLRGVSKAYPNGAVGLHSLDLDVETGERLALLGPSGSGKTTLLRLIAGLEEPDSGEIFIDGRSMKHMPAYRRGVAFLPQRPALYPHLTVRENLKVSASNDPSIDEVLQIEHLQNRYPHQLSGGEKHRVALARLVARNAPIWLLDEPFAPLDPVFRSEFRRDLHLLLGRSVATMLLVTHDPIDALALGRRVGVLGEGRMQQLGTPEELVRLPNNHFVALAVGQFYLIRGRASGGDSSEATFASEEGSMLMPLSPAIGRILAGHSNRSLTLGIRPEDIHLRPPEDRSVTGAEFVGWFAVSAEPVGSGWFLTLVRGTDRLRVSAPTGTPPRVGEPHSVWIPADRCHWFHGLTGQRIDASP